MSKRTKSRALKSAAATDGPLTLAEARAIAGVTPEKEAASKPTPRSAPKRAAKNAPRRALAVKELAPTAPRETLGAKRRRDKRLRKEKEEQRVHDYKATLALLKRRGLVGPAPAGPKGRGPRRALAAAAAPIQPLQVFAEGDSWFDYPVPLFGGGVIPRLEDLLGVPILNMAKAGDEVRFMLGVEERTQLAKRLSEGCPAGGNWDALLFSGGGNDIVGNPMAIWIRDYDAVSAPSALINSTHFNAALSLVQAAYEELISMRDQLSPETHLVFHGYDYAIPDGRGVCFQGPWLKPTFDMRNFKGLADPASGSPRFEVVKAMLTQLAEMLQTLATAHPNITVVKTQGTLAVDKSSWHNELHPSKTGFDSIAEVFRQTLKTIFPSRVL